MTKRKRKGTKRARVAAPPKLARKNGQRLWVLRKPEHQARIKELSARMKAEPDDAKRQELLDQAYALAEEPGKYTIVGIASTDPNVIFDPNTLEVIEGASCMPGDVLYPEDELERALEASGQQLRRSA